MGFTINMPEINITTAVILLMGRDGVAAGGAEVFHLLVALLVNRLITNQ